MGPSAAVSIASYWCSFDYYQGMDDEDLLEILVNRAETIAHMNPSGLDARLVRRESKPLNSSECRTLPAGAGYKSEFGDYPDTGIRQYREAIQKVEAKAEVYPISMRLVS